MDQRGEQLVSDTGVAHESTLVLQVAFALDDAIEVHIEQCTASPRNDRYGDADDALEAVVVHAAQVPGVSGLLDAEERSALSMAAPEWNGEVNGQDVRISVNAPSHKDDDWVWHLTAEVNGEQATVSCYEDDIWFGGGEGQWYASRFRLAASDLYPAFALSRFLLSHVYEATDTVPDRE